MSKGKITFESSCEELNKGFIWAKKQALVYSHDGGDPVGKWYEAALPGRDAFCMRDVAHQTYGASALGLNEHTKNMLFQFAKHINASRDYCSYWEITKDGEPCPGDYDSDDDFWLNHPGSFEVIRACYQQYLWNADADYLEQEEFRRYYNLTCGKYVKTWDQDQDGLIEHYQKQGRRGISSYNEMDINVKLAGDMVASQYIGYKYYEAFLRAMGDVKSADEIGAKKDQIKEIYLTKWYNDKTNTFYSAMRNDGNYNDKFAMESSFLPLDMEILDGEATRKGSYQEFMKHEPVNVEGRTYYPQILYRCGQDDLAFKYLLSLAAPDLERREYPEVSYSFIGAVTQWLMGVQVNEKDVVSTCSRLGKDEWAQLTELPVLKTAITIRHDGKCKTTGANQGDKNIMWKAAFYGEFEYLYIDGIALAGNIEQDVTDRAITYVKVPLDSGKAITVSTLKCKSQCGTFA